MSISKKIVEDLKKALHSCPTCGSGSQGLRQNAKLIGISSATLHRVLHGHAFDTRTLDKIDSYLSRLKPPQERGCTRSRLKLFVL